jgi:Tetratricopeptide repeat
MTRRRSVVGIVVLTTCALLCAMPGAASRRTVLAGPQLPEPGPGALAPVDLKDLAYGDALFYFYLGDDFAALNRLAVAKAENRLTHHREDAELLLGGLYLSVGEHAEAARIFKEVLGRPGVPPKVQDRARFYLGKTLFQRGYFEEAVAVLGASASSTLDEDMNAERQMLAAEAMLALDRDAQAAAVLENWQGSSIWRAYAEYNLGVARLRSGQLETGARVMEAVGTRSVEGTEALALKDQANVALGYAYVQAHRPSDAVAALSRVRLSGPQSTRALLGLGWAAADEGHFREALAPWLELHGRDLLDGAVQESYLAVPFAYAKLGADRQAAEAYEAAITEFGTETSRIDAAIQSIRAGDLAKVLTGSGASLNSDVDAATAAQVPAARYLYRLLAQNDFQAAVKNWRSLGDWSVKLEGWASGLDAFDELLAYRKKRFEETVPPLLEALDRIDVEALEKRRTDDQSLLASADDARDLATLGTPRQRAIWAELERMEAVIASAGQVDDDDIDDIADRVDFLKGVVYWDLSDGFKSRVWAARKGLRDVARIMREVERKESLIKEARTAAPIRNAAMIERIRSLRPRISSAQRSLETVRDRQLAYLADIAVRQLEEERGRIQSYVVQARYSLAVLYDKASGDFAPGDKRP